MACSYGLPEAVCGCEGGDINGIASGPLSATEDCREGKCHRCHDECPETCTTMDTCRDCGEVGPLVEQRKCTPFRWPVLCPECHRTCEECVPSSRAEAMGWL